MSDLHPFGYVGELIDEVTRLRAEVETLKARNAELEKRIKSYESWERSVNEALNNGDGSYRP